MKFGASWCHPCNKMNEETWGNEEVSDYLEENNKFLSVDIDQNPGLARQYGVRGVPATLIGTVRSLNGRFVFTPSQRIDGFMSAEEMLEHLKR